jgi:hypothetical protein
MRAKLKPVALFKLRQFGKGQTIIFCERVRQPTFKFGMTLISLELMQKNKVMERGSNRVFID